MKVFLLGLDGMTLKITEPYIKTGLLPNFKKVIEGGAYGVLRSTIPPITGPAWTSLATGKNPGKHGIYEFRRRNGYKTKLITKNTSLSAEPLWNILSRNGKKVIVVNVPFTYPPDEVNGIMISGLMTPNLSSEFVYPKVMKKELFELIPDYLFDINEQIYFRTNDTELLVEEAHKILNNRRKLMNYLIKNKPWEMFFIAFTCTDRLQHFLWNQIISMSPKCIRFYELLDDIVGDVLEMLDDNTTLLIASDHGFMSATKSFYINNFFKKSGLLEPRGSSKVKDVFAKLNISTTTIHKALKYTGLMYFKDHLPSFIINYIRTILPAGGIKENEIDWTKTKVISLLGYGLVTINLKGREPLGVVEEKEYPELCRKVRMELLKLKDPQTGRNIVKFVFLGSDVYSKKLSSERPDLIVLVNDGYSIHESLGGEIVGENRVGHRMRTGDHDEYGLFAAYGKNINNINIDADIYDIMPTILYIMGLPIPEDVDGHVLTEIINNDFVEKNQIKFERTRKRAVSENKVLDKEEQKAVEQHLKNLGYLS